MAEQTAQTVMTQSQLLEVIKALREPSDDDKEKKAGDQLRKKMAAKAAVQEAEDDCRNFLNNIRRCSHKNKRKHTWVANVCPNGIAVALCQKCRKDFIWTATDAQKMQGINLFEFDDVTDEMLRSWEKAYRPTVGEKPMRVKMGTRAGMSEDQAWAI